ncbi:ribosomal protein 63, mitochondrial [Cimex lectularius]|uniref:Ribosomal protein 63, mitochondrial n=1 Tax=Cimex lectularius TaxID=79782 RepID=A0A8I6RWN1_CIMLE|nr:ribosomal protein 63, mitochondrial [Cimex lectularius]
MRITVPLFLFKLPNGHLFRGKYRLVKRVTPKAVKLLKREFQIEEQNMFYLRHPYLTKEQSFNHMKALKALRGDPPYHTKFVVLANEKFENGKHRTLEEQLSHLKVTEDWDFKAGSI